MIREDDFQERRKHIANLTDEELYERFWQLTEQVVEPLLELGRKNTTPSVERAVLLRMESHHSRHRRLYRVAWTTD